MSNVLKNTLPDAKRKSSVNSSETTASYLDSRRETMCKLQFMKLVRKYTCQVQIINRVRIKKDLIRFSKIIFF